MCPVSYLFSSRHIINIIFFYIIITIRHISSKIFCKNVCICSVSLDSGEWCVSSIYVFGWVPQHCSQPSQKHKNTHTNAFLGLAALFLHLKFIFLQSFQFYKRYPNTPVITLIIIKSRFFFFI